MSQNLSEVSAGFERFNRAADNNKAVILEQLKGLLKPGDKVLEVGSGSGQHVVHFAAAMPDIVWQPTDTEPYFAALQQNMARVSLPNLLAPVHLNVNAFVIAGAFNTVYCANVFHIMPAELIEPMFTGVSKALAQDGQFVIYGPFKYSGEFTTPSNAGFDDWLKGQAPHQGIRDIERLQEAASSVGLSLVDDRAMPANNQLLIFR